MSELQITSLINDTWQVEGDGTVWFQGSLDDCLAYKREQTGDDYLSNADFFFQTLLDNKEQDNEKLERLQKAVVDTAANYTDAADVYTAAYDDARAAAYTSTVEYDFALAIAYYARWDADAAHAAWSKAKQELEDYLKEQDNE